MLQARIIRRNGDIILGTFDASKGVFHFDVNINHDLEKCLDIKDNSEDGYVISYIHNGDYIPRKFPLKKGNIIMIDDFYSFNNCPEEHIKLEILFE